MIQFVGDEHLRTPPRFVWKHGTPKSHGFVIKIAINWAKSLKPKSESLLHPIICPEQKSNKIDPQRYRCCTPTIYPQVIPILPYPEACSTCRSCRARACRARACARACQSAGSVYTAAGTGLPLGAGGVKRLNFPHFLGCWAGHVQSFGGANFGSQKKGPTIGMAKHGGITWNNPRTCSNFSERTRH